jgi:lipoate-protein ligase A
MSVEESLLLAVEAGLSPNTLRFWKNRRSVIIGISQKQEEELDFEICSKYNVNVVKRFTGGGAVYNDLGNLNWTIVYKKGTSKSLKGNNIQELYEELCSPVISAIRRFCLNAEFKPPTSIYLLDKKISGLSMYIKKNSVLCHGTLLLDADIKILNSVLRKIKDPVTNINDHTVDKISDWDILEKIIEQVQKKFKIKLKFGNISVEEKRIQEILPINRYKP